MAKSLVEADTIAGSATDIARALGKPLNTTIWLQKQGCIPVARLGPLWIANRSALLAAKDRARKRGEQWAQPKREEEKEYA